MCERMKKAIDNETKGDARYHNTWLLLRKYRDVTWSLEVSVSQERNSFRKEFGGTLEDFLDSVYEAGVEFEKSHLADRARGIQKSYEILRFLDAAVETMRAKHFRGEQYYWILYYTYLSSQELGSVDDIVELLRPHIKDISRRTYYRKRREAIDALSSLLWGYMDKETLDMLEGVLVEEK